MMLYGSNLYCSAKKNSEAISHTWQIDTGKEIHKSFAKPAQTLSEISVFSHMFSVCLGEGAFHYLVNHIESLWAMYGYATLCILLDLKQLARIC